MNDFELINAKFIKLCEMHRKSAWLKNDNHKLYGNMLVEGVNSRMITIERATDLVDEMYQIQLREYLGKDEVSISLRNDIKNLGGNIEGKQYFVTIGFNDKTVTVNQIKDALKKIGEIASITLGISVVEKFRKNDQGKIYEHHHMHMMITTQYAKSKLLQFLAQKLVNKKMSIDDKSFIDIKPYQDYHTKYLKGEKKNEKMECVKLDKEFRENNNL